MNKMTPGKINLFTMLKLPSAWLCGVRVKEISVASCQVSVRHRWINQNPFRSMFWAVQGMAAELTTGALVMGCIQRQKQKISMLVASNNATFSKKATGKILFSCNDGHLVEEAVQKAIETGEGQTITMKSIGRDAAGDEVSAFAFEWTIKVKQ
ncbi:DUF4442 domain-containing protein [Aquimarina hainanensis]|uniref:DUF4442 domain-containing protein n=1 Tax=Aquimarina hainanensis TaxID=1578017 RepID=A0ABW5N603_9FLAO